MRPINVSLDSHTWELAKQKTNFSGWVRAQLRSDAQEGSLQSQLAVARKAIKAYVEHGEEWAKEKKLKAAKK